MRNEDFDIDAQAMMAEMDKLPNPQRLALMEDKVEKKVKLIRDTLNKELLESFEHRFCSKETTV